MSRDLKDIRKHLHVIDTNCSWVESLATGMPRDWRVTLYRIYNPFWLPGGFKSFSRAYRLRKIADNIDEVILIVPGWNKFPGISSRVLNSFLRPILCDSSRSHHILFTFPFYSHVAQWVRGSFPDCGIHYWAHDAFEYYDYPCGYISSHEDRLVPFCAGRFAMTSLICSDYQRRYPDLDFEILCDAVSMDFVLQSDQPEPEVMSRIRQGGRPVVGCIGQINCSYDLELLEHSANANPDTQHVFVGNLFEEGSVTDRIRSYFNLPNVHWLGRIPHHLLPAYLASFDLCLNPLSISDHNDRRDPLRIYDYLTTVVPIYSLDLDGVRRHVPHVRIFSDRADLVSHLGTIPEALSDSELADRRKYIIANTWQMRAQEFVSKIYPHSEFSP